MLTKKNIIGAAAIFIVVIACGLFFFNLGPVDALSGATANTDTIAGASTSTNAGVNTTSTVIFQINQGDGFRHIADALYDAHLIRSSMAFEFFALLDGNAFDLRPGIYRLSPSMDTAAIIGAISNSNTTKTTVVIPEGSNMYDIDRILSDALVIHPGDLISFTDEGNLEGKLFPDTYKFYTNTPVKDVVETLTDTFAAKAAPLLNADPANAKRNLIIASIVEKEVVSSTDEQIVAGIILKRLAAGMPLDIDATICYAKLLATPSLGTQACQLSALDFKIDSPYNTYLYKGLPPAPIGNPGIAAITAALHPVDSPYWYYLSDPKTGKTIFAKTLDEQTQNRVKYLERD